ncbi:PIN2/TERF1-interacting telomerase inhibitor 1 [Osmerus eperlanus]|uniref:PIN2/TERF1-interacting telomerase inhibitor 1 n=1 Tax=Osmerus eperlanus TaxID=29151 RepID=UPI002E14DAE8
MSMLAEPRRKQKWSVDPRNSAWSKDESKFGQKMLERMGWSKGKGLGRTEQGSTEHIKVKVKNNNLGLGTAANHEDNWIAHQDDFNQLLADLNNCHGQNDSKEPPTEEKQSFSLEEKSKTSKKRVHYMKFTKGKDLSSRSDTDLACIFGKRATHSKTQKEESSGSDSQGEKEEEEEQKASLTPDPDVESITKTVTSTLTMQEYFAQRMALLRKGRDETQDPASSGGPAEDYSETQAPTETYNYIQNTTDDTEQPKSKKKKKKKREETAEVVEEAKEEEVCAVCPIVVDCEDQETPSQKKKKRKRAEKEDLLSENCNATPDQEQNCEEEQTPTQKKKKKKRKETSAETDLVNGQEPTENETEDQKVVNKKKKKKQREHVEEVVVVDDNDEVVEIVDDDNVVEIVDDNDEVVEIVKRKSKKDKKKKKNATIASS